MLQGQTMFHRITLIVSAKISTWSSTLLATTIFLLAAVTWIECASEPKNGNSPGNHTNGIPDSKNWPSDRTRGHASNMRNDALPTWLPLACTTASLVTWPLPVSNLTEPSELTALCETLVGTPWASKAWNHAKSRPAPESAIHSSWYNPSELFYHYNWSFPHLAQEAIAPWGLPLVANPTWTVVPTTRSWTDPVGFCRPSDTFRCSFDRTYRVLTSGA
jgi:hypothetical protein